MTISNLAYMLSVLLVTAEVLWAQPAAHTITEQSKHIPVAYDVDVVVVGGSSAGVAAACEARRCGASVFLISPRPYVGVDICAHQRLWLEPGEGPPCELGKAAFGNGRLATPLTVKKAMDEALLKAGVPYLTGCYATEALFDEKGNVAGIVMANRSGRQAVKAKVVIDGSRYAVITRQTKAVLRGFAPGKKTFRFIVVGGEIQRGENLLGRKLDVTYDSPTYRRGRVLKYPVYEYTVGIDMKDGSSASFAAAEQEVRNLVAGSAMKDCSEVLYFLPDDTVVGETRIEGPWPGAAQCDISAYRPRGVSRLYVLSAYADLDKEVAEKMLRPLEFMAVGKRIGQEAATIAKALPPPDRVELPGARPASGPVGQLVDSRERRRIIGEYILTTQDILNQRTHTDTISQHMSNFDAAAFPDSTMLLVYDMKGPDFHVDMPYRCLLPKGLDGILVIGLGASAERDAMTMVRMQPDLQNQGYAAGAAAAMAAKMGGHTRKVDIKKVQRLMVKEGVLEPRVIQDRDSYPMSESVIAGAVGDVKQLSRRNEQSISRTSESMKALAVIMAHPKRTIPLLQKAYEQAAVQNERVNYAKILAILGDNAGVPTLIAEVDAKTEWDEGCPYTSGRDVGNVFSDLDRLIISLGYSRDPRALEPVLRKTDILEPTTVLSHYKAITLALRHLRSRRAIGPLAKLLVKPGFRGHAVTPSTSLRMVSLSNQNPVGSEYDAVGLPARRSFGQLNAAFKELIIAATLYQCGDDQDMGRRILEQYSHDVNGHFARYAQAVLDGKGLPK